MIRSLTLAALAACIAGAAVVDVPPVPKACNHDNLYRCFVDARYTSSATAHCAGLPASTSTVATTTLTRQVSQALPLPELALTQMSSFSTSVVTVTNPITTDTVYSTTTMYYATVANSTTTVSLSVSHTPTAASMMPPDPLGLLHLPGLFKRQVSAAPPPPICAPTGVYPASRLTSACSCINVPVATARVTFTAPAQTSTITFTTSVTPHDVTTEWDTVYSVSTIAVATETNYLQDGDFESGNDWVFDNTNSKTSAQFDFVPVPDHSGNMTQALRLAIPPVQPVGGKSFFYWLANNPYAYEFYRGSHFRLSFLGLVQDGTQLTDYLRVIFAPVSGNTRDGGVWNVYQGEAVGNGWYRYTSQINLPPSEGPTIPTIVRLQYIADGTNPHWWIIDDIALVETFRQPEEGA